MKTFSMNLPERTQRKSKATNAGKGSNVPSSTSRVDASGRGKKKRPAWCSASRRATKIGSDSVFHVVNTKYKPQIDRAREKRGVPGEMMHSGSNPLANLRHTHHSKGELSAAQHRGLGRPVRVDGKGNVLESVSEENDVDFADVSSIEQKGRGDARVERVEQEYVKSLEEQNYLLQTEYQLMQNIVDAESADASNVIYQVDRIKQSHSRQIQQYQQEVEHLHDTHHNLLVRFKGLQKNCSLLQETVRNQRHKLQEAEAKVRDADSAEIAANLVKDEKIRELSGEVGALKELLEKEQAERERERSVHAGQMAKASVNAQALMDKVSDEKKKKENVQAELAKAESIIASQKYVVDEVTMEMNRLKTNLDATEKERARLAAEYDSVCVFMKAREEEMMGMKNEIRKQLNAIKTKNGEIQNYERSVKEKNDRVTRLENALESKTAEAGHLRQQLAEARVVANAAPRRLASEKDKRAELSKEIASLTVDVGHLEKKIQTMESQMKDVEASKNQWRDDAVRYQSALKLERDRVEELDGVIAQKEDINVDVERKNAELNERISVLEMQLSKAKKDGIEQEKVKKMLRFASELGTLAKSLA
eukprot:g1850.t1